MEFCLETTLCTVPFPLLIVQILLILAVSRTLAFFFRPLRQPRVVAEILGGILLGPSALGRIPAFKQAVFPSWSTPILGSVANMGLVFFLFLVGIELDMSAIRRSGRGAAVIGGTGIACTFGLGAVLAAVLYRTVDANTKVSYAVYTVFMGVAICITAFPVLARMLAELKLLTTRIGETAMAAAVLNDVAAWVFLAIVVSLAGNGQGSKRSPATPAWILLSSVAFVAFLMLVVKPAMRWGARKCSNTAAEEPFICLTLAGLLASAFMTDLIGIHVIFGGFVFGLTIPKEGEFAAKLTEKIEDFVSCLLLPLYFASSGLKTDVTKISNVRDVELLVLAIAVACAGKIIGTFVVALLFKFPARESLTLGILMNTKGLVELIVLNIGREDKVLSEASFTILVIMAIFTTFMTTPLVMTIYKPSSKVGNDGKPVPPVGFSDELNVLACVHGPDDASSLIHLIELTRPTFKSARLKLYIMHLAQLTDRSSSIMKFRRWRRNSSTSPAINCLGSRGPGEIHDHLSSAFAAYGEVGRARIMIATAVSPLETMHEDVCQVASENNVGMILLPFHKRWMTRAGGEEEVEMVGHGWKRVNEMVLKEAGCTVAVLIDRGGRAEMESENVCLIFFGGRDDRKALELGGRMAEKQGVKLVLMRFRHGSTNSITPVDMEQDESSINEFRTTWEGRVEILENSGADLENELLAIGRSGGYSLIVVGKGPAVEQSELGRAGDLLASSGQGITCSVLVVQSQNTQSEVDQERREIEYL